MADAAECFLSGELDSVKTLLGDYVNATIGFAELGRLIDKKPESAMRMLSAKGNPRAVNLSTSIDCLCDHEGIELRVEAYR